MEYKQKIIEIIEKMDDARFLQQLYTIIICHMKRAGN